MPLVIKTQEPDEIIQFVENIYDFSLLAAYALCIGSSGLWPVKTIYGSYPSSPYFVFGHRNL